MTIFFVAEHKIVHKNYAGKGRHKLVTDVEQAKKWRRKERCAQDCIAKLDGKYTPKEINHAAV